jgi:hypothetical protein
MRGPGEGAARGAGQGSPHPQPSPERNVGQRRNHAARSGEKGPFRVGANGLSAPCKQGEAEPNVGKFAGGARLNAVSPYKPSAAISSNAGAAFVRRERHESVRRQLLGLCGEPFRRSGVGRGAVKARACSTPIVREGGRRSPQSVRRDRRAPSRPESRISMSSASGAAGAPLSTSGTADICA